jgi:hypothetical protein
LEIKSGRIDGVNIIQSAEWPDVAMSVDLVCVIANAPNFDPTNRSNFRRLSTLIGVGTPRQFTESES